MAEEDKGGKPSPHPRTAWVSEAKHFILPKPGDTTTQYPPGDYDLLNELTDLVIKKLTGSPQWEGRNWEELRDQLRQVVAATPWDHSMVLVDRAALTQVLQALNGPGYLIREIQATRNISALLEEENPIEKLMRQVLEAGQIKRYVVQVQPETPKPAS